LKTETGNPAGGDFLIINNLINVERFDNEGRFCLVLINYTRDGKNAEYINSDLALSSKRKILVSCEVKSLKGTSHTLDFVLREKGTFEWLSSKSFKFHSQQWIKVEAYLNAGPDKDFYLKIYDHDVEQPPSSIQIKNLKLSEII
jgi:hypothetical protein